MTETKEFPTLDVVSVVTGILVSDIEALYHVSGWMLDDPGLMTHQLVAAADAVNPTIVAQHPWLAELTLPAGNIPELKRLTSEIVAEHGETLVLERPENPEWVRRNALLDMLQIADGRPVLAVDLGDGS